MNRQQQQKILIFLSSFKMGQLHKLLLDHYLRETIMDLYQRKLLNTTGRNTSRPLQKRQSRQEFSSVI